MGLEEGVWQRGQGSVTLAPSPKNHYRQLI